MSLDTRLRPGDADKTAEHSPYSIHTSLVVATASTVKDGFVQQLHRSSSKRQLLRTACHPKYTLYGVRSIRRLQLDLRSRSDRLDGGGSWGLAYIQSTVPYYSIQRSPYRVQSTYAYPDVYRILFHPESCSAIRTSILSPFHCY